MAARRTASITLDSAHAASDRLSRPTSAALGGKCTVPLKTLVPDEVADDFARFARERGYGSTSDALRDIVLVAMHGKDYLLNLHRARIDALASNLTGIGTGVVR